MTDTNDLFKLLGKFSKKNTLPPVTDWHPSVESDIDIVIERNGDWYHEGGLFQRQDLARLFSSILRVEADQYYLVTPVEKLKIKVVDVPFVMVLCQQELEGGEPCIKLISNMSDEITLSKNCMIEFRQSEKDAEPVPYVHVRDGLYARINQTVFYQLVGMAVEVVERGVDKYYLHSAGDQILFYTDQ